MRHLLPLALLLGSCGASHHAQPPVSGPPSTEPEVFAAVESRVPYQPAPTVAPTTTHTHPMTTAPAVVATAATPPVRSGDCGGWRAVVAAHFPGEQVGNACRVLLCESEGNPNAVSPTNDHGLFQINAVHHNSFDWANRYDPHTNTSFAASLWRQKGWGPWTCKP